MALYSLLFLIGFVATVCGGGGDADVEQESIAHKIHQLRPQSGGGSGGQTAVSCLSWRLGVETHNVMGWASVPEECKEYVGHYMLGQQYRKDSRVVVDQALLYAQNLTLVGDGKDVWLFDIDETALSNLPYFARHGFGVEPYNPRLFNKWIMEGKAPALPESLKLYTELVGVGMKIVFLTGRSQDKALVTANNLRNAGYHTWHKLILKGSLYRGKTALEYKTRERKKLEKKSGYRIIGNIGDQWSDLLGSYVGNRTFKLPDPMYYIT